MILCKLSRRNKEVNTQEEKRFSLEDLRSIPIVIFYWGLLAGAIWSILYYAFIVETIPEFDLKSILAYLIVIGGLGIFIVLAWILLLVFPGLLVFSAKRIDELEASQPKEKKDSWLKKNVFYSLNHHCITSSSSFHCL